MESNNTESNIDYEDVHPGAMADQRVGHFKPGLSTEELLAVYVDYLPVFEKNLEALKYTGPECAAKTLAKHVSDKQVKILDIGSGTGLVGIQLHKLGFCNADALDPSPEMLEIAKSRGLYQNLIQDKLGEHTLPIDSDTYDCLVMSGAMVENHVPCIGFLEMVRIVKPGGYIVNVLSENYLRTVVEYTRLEPFMNELESQGMLSLKERTVFPDYVTDKDGIVFVHQVKVAGLPPHKSTVLQ